MPHTREEHGYPMLVSSIDTLVITHTSARLYDSGNTIFCGALDAIAEGEEAIRSHYQLRGMNISALCL